MTLYEKIKDQLQDNPKVWLVTGVAGFIGSNLLESLLKLDQTVVGLDNLSTGHMSNLEDVRSLVTEAQWRRFSFIEGDIREIDACRSAVRGVDYVLHQAALGSVPRSIIDPVTSNAANVTGFLNMLQAAKDEGVSSFTYAASSSTYGDHSALPKVEDNIGRPLSPYAVTKYVNELYAEVYARTYDFKTIGLRYFNVFGKRQDPNGAYAAVIPKWVNLVLSNKDIIINGDGLTSRDFCYIENVVQINLLAATADTSKKNEVYNVAVGDRTTLNDLVRSIIENIELRCEYTAKIIHGGERKGDVRHSQASIEKAVTLLGYCPKYKIDKGLKETIGWYVEKCEASNSKNTNTNYKL